MESMREKLNKESSEALDRLLETLGKKKEQREEQLKMTQFLRRYLEYAEVPGHTVLVEAGTGIGKTFAYLTAIAEYLTAHSTEKFIIATNTLTLMDQLFNKDIPLIASLYPKITFRFAKGHHNYLCLNKFYQLLDTLFSDFTDEKLSEFEDYLEDSPGERKDFPEISDAVWWKIRCDRHDCLGQDCMYYNECFLNRNRWSLKDADVIITNHALALIDILQQPVFPNNGHILFDEAHNLESNALSSLTVVINDSRIQQIHQLTEESDGESFFVGTSREFSEWKRKLLILSGFFFSHFAEDGRDLTPQPYEDGWDLLNHMEKYYHDFSIKRQLSDKDEKDEEAGIANLYHDLEEVCHDLRIWLEQTEPGCVYWHEHGSCLYAPIDLSKELGELWRTRNSILVSATLTVKKSFKNIVAELGLPKEETYALRLDSPFHFKENALVYCPKNAPSPRMNMEGFTDFVAEVVLKILEHVEGHVFILFTSYKMLDEICTRCYERYDDSFDWLIQGQFQKEKLLEKYRAAEYPVLFGTDSFWEGVDEEIDCLIIAKLPFAVPTTPFEQARSEFIESHDGNPFLTMSLPKCALKLKQGVGRLIRRQDKKGIIVFCDPRITKTSWGSILKETLPAMRWTDSFREMLDFYEKFQAEKAQK